MSRALKSFDDLSLKVVAVDTIANSDVALQFPASNLPVRSPAATTPFDQPGEGYRDPLAETHGWRHGGINE
jgi:hypothetical protein